MTKYGDLTLNDYSELSEKENGLVIIVVDKNKVVYATVEKEAFKTIPKMQLCTCHALMEQLDSLKSVKKDKS